MFRRHGAAPEEPPHGVDTASLLDILLLLKLVEGQTPSRAALARSEKQ